ncbi:Copia protein [Fusarium oxysporum f. sp. albedinis]|nr:Copia protein [Fusarium oxysporum f. sp. albedinis]
MHAPLRGAPADQRTARLFSMKYYVIEIHPSDCITPSPPPVRVSAYFIASLIVSKDAFPYSDCNLQSCSPSLQHYARTDTKPWPRMLHKPLDLPLLMAYAKMQKRIEKYWRVLRRECKLAEPHGDQLEYMWRDGSSRVWNTERLSRKPTRVM